MNERVATSTLPAPRLAFQRLGKGEPLLVLHGFGTTHDDFATLLPRLGDRYDVLAMDLPGHGGSPPLPLAPTVSAIADAVVRDLDAHGLERVHVLGNSLGGRLAIELATRSRTRSVVAIAPSGMSVPPERMRLGTMMATARATNRLIRPLIAPLSRSRLGRTALLAPFRSRPWAALEAEALGVRGGFADATGYWSMLWWAILADVPTGLQQIACPVILAEGTNDLIATGQTVRYMATIPGARFRLLAGGGHAPQSDVPDQVLALVDEAVAAAGLAA